MLPVTARVGSVRLCRRDGRAGVGGQGGVRAGARTRAARTPDSARPACIPHPARPACTAGFARSGPARGVDGALQEELSPVDRVGQVARRPREQAVDAQQARPLQQPLLVGDPLAARREHRVAGCRAATARAPATSVRRPAGAWLALA